MILMPGDDWAGFVYSHLSLYPSKGRMIIGVVGVSGQVCIVVK
jgi:hypothetical protein